MRSVGRRARTLCRAIALIAIARAVPLPLAAFPLAAQEVSEVEFRGRAALDADVLEDAIATHATSCRTALASPLCLLGFDFARQVRTLDSAQVALDAERIATAYEIHGFVGASVTHSIEPDGDAVRVVFLIDEPEPYRVRSLEVTGMPDGVPPPDALPLVVGDPYALPALDASVDRIAFRLAQHGYPYAAVTVDGSVDEAARDATLVLHVEPGPLVRFGDVAIRAEAPLRAGPVRDRLAIESGAPFDPLVLERTERRLYELEAVGRATVRVEGLRDSATVLPVVVEVSPRRLRGLEAEGTVSNTDCLEAAGFWTHRHLGGRPRVVRVGAAFSNLLASQLDGSVCSRRGGDEFSRIDYRAQASLDEPIPRTAATWARVQLFAERQTAPGVFIERGWGAALALSRQPSDDLGFALEYAPRHFELDAAALYLCGNYGACEADAWQRLSRPAWLAPLTASVVWMSDGELQGVTREKLSLWRLEPLPRFRAELRGALEAAGDWSLSDFDYRRALVQASATRRFGETIELAARMRAGALFGDDVLPPRVRLFAGGPVSVRGVQQNLLGPALLVADPRDLDALGCDAATGCAGATVDPELVRLRPLGGARLVESGIEARWSFASRAQAAAFVDFGWVGARDVGAGAGAAAALRDDWIVAPGIGLRLIANIGAIRIDVALDPRGPRTLPLRSAAGPDGDIVDLGAVRYDPFTHDDPGFLREAWRRLQIHFAVGQAF